MVEIGGGLSLWTESHTARWSSQIAGSAPSLWPGGHCRLPKGSRTPAIQRAVASLGLASALPITSVLSRLATWVGEMETWQLPWGSAGLEPLRMVLRPQMLPEQLTQQAPPNLGFPGCGVSEAAERWTEWTASVEGGPTSQTLGSLLPEKSRSWCEGDFP